MAASWHKEKIGVGSVTYLGSADPGLFRLQLDQIDRNSRRYDVTTYLAMPRVSDAERRIAEQYERVTVVDTGRPELKPNQEHAFHLGAMSRSPRFRTDIWSYPLQSRIWQATKQTRLWRIAQLMAASMAGKNDMIRRKIVSRLLSEPQALLDELRGTSTATG